MIKISNNFLNDSKVYERFFEFNFYLFLKYFLYFVL